ncbi:MULTISPECIES: DUF4998 domain-containing protein [Sphingobacterium]|uniref:DUF4998 domain-containing protein n=1 Tax=Sphingobacterium TaxID=28453 RepID=UPI00257A7E28|nr:MULTISPECIES: DUF4998 domain-containing protein [Sphingobacterium]
MKNNLTTLICCLLALLASCSKQQTDFRDLLGGHEIVYTGLVGQVIEKPGNLRTILTWKKSSDPSIVKYVIFYNQKDSVVVDVTDKKDSVSATITNLEEAVYTFTIYSYDAKGNKSVPKLLNAKIYGPIYQASLLNRPYNGDVPYVAFDNGKVELNFNKPDTVNVTTTVKYTTTANTIKEADLAPTDSILHLNDYKPGTEIRYRSFYKPTRNAIDIFSTTSDAVFPPIYFNILCDKSLFRELSLPNDVGTLAESPLRNLWDGSVGPQGYPNIYHSQGNVPLPHTISFDMGKIYNNLSILEETGRNCCHNPDQFEVWGIADISNAATTLPANDAGWKDEAIRKGWTLLLDAVRTDDGSAAKKFELIKNPPPVRYIRIRVKHNANGDTNQSNMSELSFWNGQ